jgi:hypothetical protein
MRYVFISLISLALFGSSNSASSYISQSSTTSDGEISLAERMAAKMEDEFSKYWNSLLRKEKYERHFTDRFVLFAAGLVSEDTIEMANGEYWVVGPLSAKAETVQVRMGIVYDALIEDIKAEPEEEVHLLTVEEVVQLKTELLASLESEPFKGYKVEFFDSYFFNVLDTLAIPGVKKVAMIKDLLATATADELKALEAALK